MFNASGGTPAERRGLLAPRHLLSSINACDSPPPALLGRVTPETPLLVEDDSEDDSESPEASGWDESVDASEDSDSTADLIASPLQSPISSSSDEEDSNTSAGC